MVSQLIKHKSGLLNAAIYIDYENIFELLHQYGINPLMISFFPVVLDRLKNEYDLDIIECIAYANFEKKALQGKHLSTLHNLGVDTRHSASQGKNCGDLMLTVDTLTTLYKNHTIDVFIIISSDSDMIPLLRAMKRENKFTILLSTKYGFNPMVSSYADCHEYIEDIFNLTPDMLIKKEEVERLEILINNDNLNNHDIEKAKEVAKFFYSSNIWKLYEKDGNPITLQGYLKVISPKIGRDAAQVIRDFELAHHYKYVTIYKDDNKGFCLKKGDNYLEILGLIEC